MTDEIRENAEQHGIAAANHIAGKVQSEGMSPTRGSELLNGYIIKQAERMLAHGTARNDILAWIRAVEAAFDEQLATLAKSEGA